VRSFCASCCRSRSKLLAPTSAYSGALESQAIAVSAPTYWADDLGVRNRLWFLPESRLRAKLVVSGRMVNPGLSANIVIVFKQIPWAHHELLFNQRCRCSATSHK
jgi:hypothetical protein